MVRPDPFQRDHGPFAEATSCLAAGGFVAALEHFHPQPEPIRVENTALRVCRHLGAPLGFCWRGGKRRWMADAIGPGHHFVFGAGAATDLAWDIGFETLSVTAEPATVEGLGPAAAARAAAFGVEVIGDDALMERLSGALLLDALQGFARGGVFLEGLCLALASHILHPRPGAGAAPALSDGDLRRVRALVEERLAERLTLSDLAAAVGLPPHRLSRASAAPPDSRSGATCWNAGSRAPKRCSATTPCRSLRSRCWPASPAKRASPPCFASQRASRPARGGAARGAEPAGPGFRPVGIPCYAARSLRGARMGESDDLARKSFEEALQELEEIVKSLEGGKGSLAQAIADYERGAALRRHCEAKLAEAEAKVQAIMEGPAGPALRDAE